MSKSIILTTSLALALAFSTAVFAQRPGGRHGGTRDGGPFLGLARNLDLTEDQRATIRALAMNTRTETQPIRAELRETTTALRAEVLAGNSARVTELSAKVSSLRQQLADVRLKTTASIVALLTPEQKEKLNTVRPNRAGQRQEPGPRRGGRGGPDA